MFGSLFHNKRGASEIIANLIIILIVSVAGVALYSYSLGAFSSSSSSFQLQTDQRGERTRERFLIIAVWWDTVDKLNLTALNYGKIELAIDAVYIDGTQVSPSAYTDGKGVTIVKENMIPVKFTLPVSIVSGQSYEIVVVSERGSKDAVYWEA